MLTLAEFNAARRAFPFRWVSCPHCGEALNKFGPIVLASRRCLKCGKRVLAEPDPLPAAFAPDEFEAACAVFRRKSDRAAWACGYAMLWVLLGGGALAVFRDTLDATVGRVIDPGWFFLAVAFGPAVALVVLAFRDLGRATKGTLKCPECGGACATGVGDAPNLPLLTGNCFRCGRHLIDVPAADPPGPLPSAAEFRAACDRANREPLAVAGFVALALPFVALMFAAQLIGGEPRQFWSDFERKHGPMAEAWAAVGVTFGVTFLVFGGMGSVLYFFARRLKRRQRAEPLLSCPACQELLSPSVVVVASRRCPKCRAVVLADGPASGTA